MLVSELIALLQDTQRYDDTVMVWNRYMGEFLEITNIDWDCDEEVVSINTVFVPPPVDWEDDVRMLPIEVVRKE